MNAAEVGGSPGPAGLRRMVREHAGFDPGVLSPATRLDDAGIVGLARLSLVAALERTYQVDLPADLVTALETVDDLRYFVAVKLDQRSGPATAGSRNDRGTPEPGGPDDPEAIG
jgi:acyl carrier protein